jgi:hypothetical protein
MIRGKKNYLPPQASSQAHPSAAPRRCRPASAGAATIPQ